MDPVTEPPAPFEVPPIPLPPTPATAPARQSKPGQLTPGWSTVYWITWAGVAAAWAAVWVSSRTTGLSTWWLGPEAEPRSVLLSLLPFVLPLALAAAAFAGMRCLPHAGIAGALVQAAIGLGDLGRVDAYATVELAIAAGALCVSVASFAGLLRKPFG